MSNEKDVTVADFRANLSQYLNTAQSGGIINISCHGYTKATLVSATFSDLVMKIQEKGEVRKDLAVNALRRAEQLINILPGKDIAVKELVKRILECIGK